MLPRGSAAEFRSADAHIVPEVEATNLNAGDDILWIDAGRDELLNAKRKALQKVPTILTLILRQVSAGFVKCDGTQITCPTSK